MPSWNWHFDEAERYYREALRSDGRLTPKQRVQIREYYARLLLSLARYEEADQVLRKALQIAELEMVPNASAPVSEWWHTTWQLACCHNRAGLLDLYIGRFAEAEQRLRQAIGSVAQLSDDYPQLVWLPYHYGLWQTNLAEVFTAMEQLEEAEEAWLQSLAAWESAGTPVFAIFPLGKGLAHYRLGELLHRTGRTEEASRQFALAQGIMEDLARRQPDESVCHWQLICLLANCPDPAMRDPARAVALTKRVLPEQAGHYWRYLALAEYRSDQWQDAAASIQQAMDLRQGGDAFDWLLLAMTHWQLGQKEEAIERYTQAQEAIKTGKPLFYEYLGVMAVQRLQREAEMLLGNRIENAKEE